MKRPLIVAIAPAALAVIAAGCGGASSTPTAAGGGAYGAAAATAKPVAATSVSTAHTKLGTVLADAKGRTLYLFEKDKGPMSSCYGACAAVWPPLTSHGKAMGGTGIAAAKLGASRRTDGTAVVTYGGHPLYTYAGDTKRGDVKGQGLDQFGAEWYVVAPSGRKIDEDG
jgi:predicted lipoprotein with Yx(FWY)xxD motif